MIVWCFDNGEKIVSIRQESLNHCSNMVWKQEPHYKIRIKAVKYENFTIFGSIRKIWPIKTIPTIIPLYRQRGNSFQFLVSVSLFNIDRVLIQVVTDFDQSSQIPFLIFVLYDHCIVSLKEARFNTTFEGSIEILVLCMQNIDISVIVFARNEEEFRPITDALS